MNLMKTKRFFEEYENCILAGGLLLILSILTAIGFDYYFALNDDVLIKDIISGLYTGTPESRNNQMLYPLSLFFSLLYKVLPAVPWYGGFLWLCHYGCLFLILHRVLKLCENRKKKRLICLPVALVLCGMFLEHLVLVQYTVTSGLLAATALFLLVTEQDREHLFRKSIPYLGLAILALLLRSEMLLLMLPFLCVAGLYVWGCEKKIFTAAHFKKYFGIIGCLLGLVAGMLVIDGLAYSGEDWNEFRRFFDARTTLYDYTGVPVYEQNEAFYETNNIGAQQYELLKNYNYGLDESMDAVRMEHVAEYAEGIQDDFFARLKMGLVRYKYRITNRDGEPYCFWAVAGYVLLALAIHQKNKWRLIFTVGMMLMVRSVVWVYILMTNRIPDRITHPLYFAEFLLLAAVFITEIRNRQERKVRYGIGLGIVVLLLVGLINLGNGIKTTEEQIVQIEENNVANAALLKYSAQHPEDFFFLDVYSTIYFTEKIFTKQYPGENRELLGGWICNSPLYDKKLQAYGMTNVEEGLADHDNVFLVQNRDSYLDWLVAYYESKGYRIEIAEEEILDGGLVIYSLKRNE